MGTATRAAGGRTEGTGRRLGAEPRSGPQQTAAAGEVEREPDSRSAAPEGGGSGRNIVAVSSDDSAHDNPKNDESGTADGEGAVTLGGAHEGDAATETAAVAGDEASRGPGSAGSGGLRRKLAIGLGVAAAIAGVAVLSVFIYSIFDDGTDKFSTDLYTVVDDGRPGGWFGYAPLSPDEDRRLGRDGGRGDGRDRPVGVRRHDEGAGRARDAGRAGSRAGHANDPGGDKADGYADPLAGAASNGCVEVKDLGRRVLLMCDRADAGGKGVEGWWHGSGERPGREGLDGGRTSGWGVEPGARWSGRPWWLSDDGQPNQRTSLGGFPSGDFYGLAPEDCREIPLRGTSLESGAVSRIECVTPSSAFCTEGEVYGPRGFAFADCAGFAGGFPPGWPGPGRASSWGWFPLPSEDGYSEGGAGPSKFLEGLPAGPEEPFGLPGVGIDFGALVDLIPYFLGGETFEEFLGSILDALLSVFEGLPEGEGDSDPGARAEPDRGGLPGGLDEEFLGMILEGLLEGFDGSAGTEGGSGALRP